MSKQLCNESVKDNCCGICLCFVFLFFVLAAIWLFSVRRRGTRPDPQWRHQCFHGVKETSDWRGSRYVQESTLCQYLLSYLLVLMFLTCTRQWFQEICAIMTAPSPYQFSYPFILSYMAANSYMASDWHPRTKILTNRETANIGLDSSVGRAPVR